MTAVVTPLRTSTTPAQGGVLFRASSEENTVLEIDPVRDNIGSVFGADCNGVVIQDGPTGIAVYGKPKAMQVVARAGLIFVAPTAVVGNTTAVPTALIGQRIVIAGRVFAEEIYADQGLHLLPGSWLVARRVRFGSIDRRAGSQLQCLDITERARSANLAQMRIATLDRMQVELPKGIQMAKA